MNIKRKIGWQKYEDMLEHQLESPLLESFIRKIHGTENDNFDEIDLDELSEEEVRFIESLEERPNQNLMVPIDEKLMENITLANNFDCWMGHTNFNITKKIRDTLQKTEGVEVLKICSRYRFFIGVGRMFDFKDVRKTIEDSFLEGEKPE